MEQLECVTLCLPCSLMVVEKVCLLNYFCCPQNIRCYIYVKSCYYQQSDTNDNLLSFLMLEIVFFVLCNSKNGLYYEMYFNALSDKLDILDDIGSENKL